MSTTSTPHLFLVDGYALIYRAFFAMIGRPLRTSRGENTSAVWGVANFLHRLFTDHELTHMAWVHDAGTSFREEVYPEYKATREKLDEELQEDFDQSVERIGDLLRCFGVPLVSVEGYEADDVIGTLADVGVAAGFQVVIVSGDKDFYQLVAPRIALLNPGRGGPAGVAEVWVDGSNAHERLGVPPERVVDFLALVGDASDNIPGVRGIGEKTARVLIEAYGDLDSILAHAAAVSGKRAREALLNQGDNARLSRELVTIRRDVPTGLAVSDLLVGEMDLDVLTRLYTELEFHSLLPRLQAQRPVAVSVSAPSTSFATITTPATCAYAVCRLNDVASVVQAARSAPIVSVDTETTSLDPMRADLVGLSLAIGPDRAWYLPFGHHVPDAALLGARAPENLPSLERPELRALRELLADPAVAKAGHNIKYDWLVLRRAGVALRGVAYDSMLASFLLDPGRRSHALDVLAFEYLDVRLASYADLVGRGKSQRPFAEVPVEEAAAYCCADASAVLELRRVFEPELQILQLSPLLAELDVPLIGVLVDMESRGIAVDVGRLGKLAERFGGELGELERKIHEEAGTDFNINSTPQLRHVLFDKLGLPVLKKTKTGPSTDADVLSELAAMGHPLPRLLLDYRELGKLKSTYVDVLPQRVHPETGRIHTDFSQVGAATGRLSSSEPNLQNIPVRTARGEEIRRCFVPSAGSRFIVADYSQIELRLLAHLSQDPQFIDAFRRGGDIHRETAAVIFGVALDAVTPEMRTRAKTINFATIYGQGPFALSRQLEIPQEEARAFIDLYFERFAGVRRFLDDCIARAKDLGYAETLFGRRRYIPELKDRSYNVRAFGERVAMNSPLQGSAADLIKRAMLGVSGVLSHRRFASCILLQVHDELVVEAPIEEVDQAADIVRSEMEHAANLSVPLVVEIGVGDNWLAAKA